MALGFQSAYAFSLLGPVAIGDDAWQVTLIGYNPLPGLGPPGFTDGLLTGPKNLGESYRRNAGVMYYGFDASWQPFFGSNGEYAVQQAFDLLNGVMNGQGNTPLYLYSPTNGYLGDATGPAITLTPANSLDSYSAGLAEFPFNSEGENYTASALGLLDVKSVTLSDLLEQLGLADAVRYTWALHDRFIPPGAVCNPPGPGNGVEYTVVQRNLDIIPSALNQLQYSAYVNGELYSYWIDENCGVAGGSPPDVDALEIPVDTLNNAPPVASGNGVMALVTGFFYTGLTRDDVGGLRWLYSTNNYDSAHSPAYLESQALGSAMLSYSTPTLLFTTNYNLLVATAMTNDPATLAGLFPGIQFNYLTNYWSNVVSSSMTFVTNFPIGGPSGQGFVGLQTNYSTNLVDFFIYSFGNVVTNKVFPTTSYRFQTITVGPPIGSPVGSAFVTNVTYSSAFQSNIASGDYFVITNGSCPPNIILTLQTNVNIVTNLIAGTTNTDGSSIVQNLVYFYTNYVFEVNDCTLTTASGPQDFLGLGRMQFIRISDDDPFDYLTQQLQTAITNQYSMVVFTNGQYQIRKFQRIVTRPDFLFAAQDLATGPGAVPGDQNRPSRNVNFNQTTVQTGLAGPGTIDTPTTFTFNKVGPVYENTAPASLIGPSGATTFFLWGSFDGTTNAPVVYPNGTSLVNLGAAAVIQIFPAPPTLPSGTAGVGYSVAFSATGTIGTVHWQLAPGISAGLPNGLNLSDNGVLSGTPTQRGTFDNIIVEMSDSSTPPRVVDTGYSLTIN